MRIFNLHIDGCPNKPKAPLPRGMDSVNERCRLTCRIVLDGEPLKGFRSLQTKEPDTARERRQLINRFLAEGFSIDEAFRRASREWARGGAVTTRTDTLTVTAAKNRFFAHLEKTVVFNTWRTHDNTWRRHILDFVEEKGIEFLDELTSDIVLELLATWKWSPKSKNTLMKRAERFRSFFNYAIEEGFGVVRNPVPMWKKIKTTLPFSDLIRDVNKAQTKKLKKRAITAEEFKMVLDALAKLAREAKNPAKRAAYERARVLFIFMRLTGVRISDAVRLESGWIDRAKSRLTYTPWKTRRHDEKPDVCVPVRQFVLDELDSLVDNGFAISEQRLFWTGESGKKDAPGQNARALTSRTGYYIGLLRAAFKAAGLHEVFNQLGIKHRSHQCRKAYSTRIVMVHGTTAAAEAIGDTERVVENAYNLESDERDDAREQMILASMENDPTVALFEKRTATTETGTTPMLPRPRRVRAVRRGRRASYSS